MKSLTPHKNRIISISAVTLMSSFVHMGEAHAQVTIRQDHYTLFTEAWLNATAGGGFPDNNQRDGTRGHVFADSAIRSRVGYTFDADTSLSARVVLASNSDVDEAFRLNQATAIYQTTLGRLEFGRRQGLPDVLGGYAPNPYTYTSADFGPASGVSLDPDGGLPTRFLAPALRAQIDAISYLGNTPALAGDRSIKGLYVSPRINGFIFGVAYTPSAGSAPTGLGRNFSDLVQSGVTYENYDGQNIYRIGTSYTFAKGDNQNNVRYHDLHSFSGGASVSLHDLMQEGSTTTFGVNISSDADTGLAEGPFQSTAIGVTTSVNHEIGPWTYGGYYQYASAAGETAIKGNDSLHILEIGSSYRFTEHFELFNAAYLYQFNDENASLSNSTPDGAVLLAGFRTTL